MTALAGYWAFGQEDAQEPCAAMLTAQAIYGKHSRSRSMGKVALGRRLWPLTPEDAFDDGPLSGGDGRLLLCADARIDNRAEVAAMLNLPGPIDKSSDAAVVLAAYEHWGDAAFDRLCGAFAVMVWDAEKQSLILARDALGERPLHYHIGDGFVAVASMPKGLHGLRAIPYAASSASMADFLALVPETGSDSFFEGVARVPPGHIVVINSRSEVRSTRYWNPATDALHLANDADYSAAMQGALDQAVACRLRRASGAIGSHLSAGLDSSSVTATAARLSGPDQLLAFTAVPTGVVADVRGGIVDEGPLSAATAAMHSNVQHIRLQSGATSPLIGLDRHFRVFERPILNPSNAVWNDAINDAAQARGVSVMLTGQMGNMSISHAGMQQLSQLARSWRVIALGTLMLQMRQRGHRWRGLAAQAFGPFIPPALWLWLARNFSQALGFEVYNALRPVAFDAFAVGQRALERGLDLSYRPWADSKAMRLWVMRRVDLGVYNKGTLAGWGIDLRDPTADRRLIELCLRIPESQFILRGETRSLARRAFADRLPLAVVSERRRGVQAADWRLGMAGAHSAIGEELVVLERNAQSRALMDLERLKKAHSEWPGANSGTDVEAQFYRDAMLRAIAAGHFLRKVGRTN